MRGLLTLGWQESNHKPVTGWSLICSRCNLPELTDLVRFKQHFKDGWSWYFGDNECMYPFGGNVSTSSGGSGSWIYLWPSGVLENRLISLSVVVKPTNTSHIFLFSQKFWQLSWLPAVLQSWHQERNSLQMHWGLISVGFIPQDYSGMVEERQWSVLAQHLPHNAM